MMRMDVVFEKTGGPMNPVDASKVFTDHYTAWVASQEGQTDGIEFEASYLRMLRAVGHEVLRGSVGDVPQNRNKKNCCNVAGQD
jgi:hypothetical protein